MNSKIRTDLMKAHGAVYKTGPDFLDRVNGRDAYSVFANEMGESLSARKVAAKNLRIALSGLPEASINGPIRSAMIKCDLAATHSETHDDVSRLFCAVSELMWKADQVIRAQSAA